MTARNAVRRASRVVVATVGFLLVCATGSALAANFTVTSATDAVDAGGCTVDQCTLRDAVIAANAAPGSTINLPARTYNLTIPPTGPGNGNDDARSGDLNITAQVTITGAGASSTIIDGGGTAGTSTDRVFRVETGGVLELSGATIQHGHPAAGLGMLSEGGGILALGALKLTDASVSNNFVDPPGMHGGGAGIAQEASVPIALTRTTVSGNTVRVTSAVVGGGGGLLLAGGAGGDVTITDSLIAGNNAAGPGGGIYSNPPAGVGGSITITGTQISDDNAHLPPNLPNANNAFGGGLATSGTVPVTLTNDEIASNTADQAGGGVFDNGASTYTITDTLIEANTAVAGFTAGNTFLGGGGIGADGRSTNPGWVLSGDMIFANTAGQSSTVDANVPGGGIDEDGGDKFTLVNTTIIANSATGPGGGYETSGGGTHKLTNVTIDENSAGSGGGDLDSRNGGTFTLGNTIVSTATPVNCAASTNVLPTSLGHNLDSANTCGFTHAGDLTNTDPMLALRGANGGPTLTQALNVGSPAIDAGDNALCAAIDQRGVSRPQPQNGVCDIGAYELIHSITVTNANDSGPGSLRDAITFAGSGTTIDFSPALNGQTIGLTSGALIVPHGVTISGPGASQLTINGNNADTVFDIEAPDQLDEVTISGLTLTGGASSGSSGGGAIFANSVNALTLNGDTITGNSADISSSDSGGGGVFTDATTITTITNSTVTNNTVTSTDATSSSHGGGGIYNDGGALLVSGSVVSGNAVKQTSTSNPGTDGGGGIYDNGDGLTLTNSSVDNNSVTMDTTRGSDGGAGVYENGDTLAITGSTINGNSFTLSNGNGGFNGGAGVFNNGGDVTVTSTSIDGNSATITDTSATVGQNGGVGLYNDGNNLAVIASTIAENTGVITSSTAGMNGGGAVFDQGETATYLNSTLSGNSVTVNGAGAQNGGGAIYGLSSSTAISISASTIAGNAINQPGGAIFDQAGTYTIKSSILAGNSQGNCAGVGPFTSAGFNLESANTCGFTAAGDLTNTDPKLGPLQDNGGPTPTRALPANSPAVDAGSCSDVAGNPVSTDQRGVARPQPAGGNCDIGAFELAQTGSGGSGPPPPPPPSPAVTGGAPTTQTSSAAALSGSVNPEGTPTQAFFQYGLDLSERGPGASTVLYDQSTPVQQVGSDATNHTVTAPLSGLLPGALYHVRLVAISAAGTTFGPDQTFTTAQAAAPPPPVLGQTGNVKPVTGTVFIKSPSGQFIPLTGATKIPNGSQIDALHGSLQVITAIGKGKTEQGIFGGAVFKFTQARTGLTTLSLIEGAFPGAPSFSTCKPHKAGESASVASGRTLQLLHASANGKFRTSGRYSAATVRGTKWTIADRCDGTLTHDIVHSVVVTDFVHHRTIVLHAGQSYLAKAPGRK
jgi:CSLREA domain-containing protein